MKKIRVLQVNKLYYPVRGGIEKVVQQIAEGLNEYTDMQVLVCQQKGRTTDEVVNGVRVHRCSSKGILFSLPISFSFIRDVRRYVKKAEILQIHMPFPLADIACLVSGYQGKIILWWHSDIVRQKKMMIFYRPILERLLKKADKIIVATQGHIDGSKYLKYYKEKCVIIPYGVDDEVLNLGEAFIGYEQSEINVSDISNSQTKFVNFLFVGRLVYYKGCDILLKAFAQTPNAVLTIVGEGSLGQELKKLAENLHIEDRVRFLGDVKREVLYSEYKNCDVFVLPSVLRSEAFGLVQIEAMAFGKPVINTNLPSGVPYVSVNGISGLTVEPGDVDELSKAMKWMIEHEKERVCMGIEARKRVDENYTIHNMLQNVLELYNTALEVEE